MPKAKLTEAEKKQRREERSDLKMLERIQKVGCVHKTMSPNGGNSGSYFSFPDGKVPTQHVIHRLISSRRLRPTGDGLFGDSQTFVAS